MARLPLRPPGTGGLYGAREKLHVRRQGRQGLRLLVAEENAFARRFYEREGFRCIGQEEGSSGPLLLLEKSLKERRDGL